MTTALKIASDRGFTVASPFVGEHGTLNKIEFILDFDSFYAEIDNFVEGFPGNYVDIDEAIEKAMESMNDNGDGVSLRDTRDDKQVAFAIEIEGDEPNPTDRMDSLIERFCLEVRDEVISEIECDDDVPKEDIWSMEVETMSSSWASKFNYSYHTKELPVSLDGGNTLKAVVEVEAYENELNEALDGIHTHKMASDVMEAVGDAKYPRLSFDYDEDQKEVEIIFTSDLKTPLATQSILNNMEAKVNHALIAELSGIDKSLTKNSVDNEASPTL
ncbi:hypothetical protein [Vibrio harveyi]|uniref:hypothetical protein n=1 Tax=Vibrio harveyi TaxID=669 RepID=UPI003CE7F086